MNDDGITNFDWLEFDDLDWRQRFPGEAAGAAEWRNLPHPEGWESLESLGLPSLHDRAPWSAARPRVFISHRQRDRSLAEAAARMATAKGFYYWLDVHDPNLAAWNLQPDTPQKSIAIAAIIEMALLNCTHVLAIVSGNTKGSAWVPYEYGRVKIDLPVSIQAAAWVQPDAPAKLPEYLYLGAILMSAVAVDAWLGNQAAIWPP